MRKLIDILNPTSATGGMIGRLLLPLVMGAVGALLALLLIPGSPLNPGPDLSRRGPVGGFQAGAGAGLSFVSPSSRLGALGIPYTERFVRSGEDYTPGNLAPRAVVVHNTDSPASSGCGPVYNTFVGPVQASTHYCIETDGTVWALVPLDSIAWGNGDVSSPNMAVPLINEVVSNKWWMNQYTWSIELVLDYSPNTEYLENYPAMQESLTVLLKFLSEQGGFPLTRNTVLTHRDINASGRVDPICCWRQGGLAAGAQAFDSYVNALGAAPTPTPPATVSVVALPKSRVFQIGQALYTFDGGELRHIPDPFALSLLEPYEILPVAADNPLMEYPVRYSGVPGALR